MGTPLFLSPSPAVHSMPLLLRVLLLDRRKVLVGWALHPHRLCTATAQLVKLKYLTDAQPLALPVRPAALPIAADRTDALPSPQARVHRALRQ